MQIPSLGFRTVVIGSNINDTYYARIISSFLSSQKEYVGAPSALVPRVSSFLILD